MSDLIEVFENILDPATCRELINIFESSADVTNISKIVSANGVSKIDSVRKSDGLLITQKNCGELYKTVQQAIQQVYKSYCIKYPVLKNIPKVSPEPMGILRYADANHEYGWHVDGADKGLRYRFLSIVLYLNTVTIGGETEFRVQQRKVSPKEGAVVVFPSGWTHEHRGLAPESNAKYIIATWLRFGDLPKL